MSEVTEINITEAIENEIDRSNWVKWKFSDLVENIVEKVVPKDSSLEHYIGLEHLDTESLKIRRFGETSTLIGDKLKIYKGDLIFAKRNAYLKRVAIAEFDAVASAHSMVLRPKSKNVNPDFLPFFLMSEVFWKRAIEISVGSLSPTINWKALAKQEFLLPPKDQQAQLAELLWAMDEVIERETALHKTLEKSKFSVLRNRIIEFSSQKQYQTLGDLGKWTSGGTPSKKNLEYWENGTIPWITPKDMKGDYLTASLDYVTDKSVQDNKAKVFKKGRTVLVWRSGILQHTLPIARVERDFCVNQDLKVFEPKNEKFIEEFIRVFLKVNSENIRRECVKEGTTVQSIDTNSFMKFVVPEIALDLQKKIIDEEVAFENAIIFGFNKYNTSKALQKSLINQIF